MKVAILGFDMEGKSSFEYFKARGDEICICDQNPDIVVPDGIESQLGENYLENLDRFDLLIRTAGLPPHKILQMNAQLASKISSQVNEFFKASPTRNIIGVTGTKGKGTTSTLIKNMLQVAGKQVFLAGNIGVPALSLIDEITENSWVVLELSSFQLIDLQTSPHLGVCLMVAPEHLNWHADMGEYTTAKAQLFAHQTSADTAIYFASNDISKQIASAGDGQKVPYFAAPGAIIENDTVCIGGQTICKTSEVKLLGNHNLQNICAAVTAVWQAGVRDVADMKSVLTTFTGLEHRLELVRELNGVKYYDDSFGTTPETAIVAIEAFAQPKIVIVGGSDKGASFDELAQTIVDGNVRQAIIIGNSDHSDYTATGPAIIAGLQKLGFTNYTSLVKAGGTTMEEIVQTAHAAAQPGDIVLLSTGSASFDLFANYKDRGNQFRLAVEKLS